MDHTVPRTTDHVPFSSGFGSTAAVPRIAIVHDQLYAMGGAERVLQELLACFPEADVFALFDILPAADRQALVGHRRVGTTWLQAMPFLRRLHRHYMPLMPLAIEQLDLRQYDIIISSSYLVAKGVIVRPDQIHVCYLHSPMRYAWDQQEIYVRDLGGLVGFRQFLARLVLHYMRLWDLRSSVSVDLFVANSGYVARRALKCYRRACRVVYPPVDVERFAHVGNENRDDGLFVTVTRLTPYKRVDLMVDAFRHLPESRLVVVGDGPVRSELERKAPPNVEFRGRVPEHEVNAWLGAASAFLFMAEEDFGISPVEAQACGTPVIAFARGGAAETVIDVDHRPEAATGILVPTQEAEALRAAVLRLRRDRHLFRAETCRENAARFSQQRFRQQMTQIVTDRMTAPEHAAGILTWAKHEDPPRVVDVLEA